MSLHITIHINRISDPYMNQVVADLINHGHKVEMYFDLDEVDEATDPYTAADYATATERVNKLRDEVRLKQAMADRPEYFDTPEWKARLAVECPTCWSGRGASCVRPTGESYGNKYVHKARLDAYANLI